MTGWDRPFIPTCGCDMTGTGSSAIPNRLPSLACFCTSCIFTSISFCFSAEARTLACFSHVIDSENLLAVAASSAFLMSFSIFSRFSLASFVSVGTDVEAFGVFACAVAFSACFSKFSALASSPCTFCSGCIMVCRNPMSSSAGVPFTTSGTMFCRMSSFRLFLLGMTATLRLFSTLRILMLRSVPAVII